jgi:NAD(P)-dependent dehydrogenase (short-subunit alcohol dehydrogenase family)
MNPRPVYTAIRVNTLSPGYIDTPLSEAARVRGLTDELAKQNMLGRISQPEEYRTPVLFLLGEGSSYMTGAVSSSTMRLEKLWLTIYDRICEWMVDIVHGKHDLDEQ